MTPEDKARQTIDAQLTASGWVIQDYKKADFSAGRGIALREVPLTTGPCDYLLLVDRKPLGVVEAKKEGTTLSTIADQSARYASSLPPLLAAGLTGPLPFLYESTGVETFFRDERDPAPRSRRVFTFHRPETLAEWAAEPDTLRRRLAQMPTAHPLDKGGRGDSPMRDCQVEAITGLEKSFAEDRPRALIHMATGAGKTYTACAFTYRLIKYAKARRVLFLVDRSNLGEQARDEFHRFRTPDTGRLFTELYNVQHLTSPHIDDVCRVTICTIQRLYSILRGEELAEGADDLSGAELARAISSGGSSGRESAPSSLPASLSQSRLTSAATRSLDVAYNPSVPIEKFDFIVTDECHRSIYNLWRQVLEYFDASLIGLTATPAPQTIAYFHQNRVAEYNHERAVADGVNVGYDVYRIKTRVTEAGGKVEKGFLIDHRSKASRQARAEVLADDLDYTPEDLDRSVVVPDQIRTVLRAYRDVVQTELFPGRTLVPKTLISQGRRQKAKGRGRNRIWKGRMTSKCGRSVTRWQSSNWSPACREIASPTCSETNCCVPPRPLAQTTGRPAARDRRLSSSPKSATPSGKPMNRSIGSNCSPNLARSPRRSPAHTCRKRANSWRSSRQSSRTPKAMTTVVDLSLCLSPSGFRRPHFAFCFLPSSFASVFGKGNDFCRKITYQAKHPVTGKPVKGRDLIKEFCNSTMPRIAVTVDMIATGTDIKPLEVLLFLRDVRSRVYFEQMKGRGTRVLSPTDLQSVSGEDARAKTRFVIVDAVGVCESDKTESRLRDLLLPRLLSGQVELSTN